MHHTNRTCGTLWILQCFEWSA